MTTTIEMILAAFSMGLMGLVAGVLLANQIVSLLSQLKIAVLGLVAQVKALFSKAQ